MGNLAATTSGWRSTTSSLSGSVPFTFTRPPSQDPNQKVSVVFAMDYSQSVENAALTAMQNAVISFINAMHDGDFAAIVKFNGTNPSLASVVQPFTAIDQWRVPAIPH